jgi:hypothetical protein
MHTGKSPNVFIDMENHTLGSAQSAEMNFYRPHPPHFFLDIPYHHMQMYCFIYGGRHCRCMVSGIAKRPGTRRSGEESGP